MRITARIAAAMCTISWKAIKPIHANRLLNIAPATKSSRDMPAPRKPEEKTPQEVQKYINQLSPGARLDEWERTNAAERLGELGHPAAVPKLSEALKETNSMRLKIKAAEALGKIKDPAAVPVLIEKLYDFFETAGAKAAEALGNIADERAIPHLVNVLHPVHIERATNAKEALVKIGRALQDRKATSKQGKALKLVTPHLRENDAAKVIEKAYLAALEGKVTAKNARLYVKQLRALKGNVK